MGDYLDLRRHPWYAFHVYARKVIRWLIALPTLSLLSVAGPPRVSASPDRAGLFNYLAALVDYVADRRGSRGGFLALPFYFCLVNLASLVGFVRALRGERVAVWRTVR